MEPTDIYCKREARDRLIKGGMSPSKARAISEKVDDIVKKALKCDKCAP